MSSAEDVTQTVENESILKTHSKDLFASESHSFHASSKSHSHTVPFYLQAVAAGRDTSNAGV